MPDHDPTHPVALPGLRLEGPELLQRECAVRLVSERPDRSGPRPIGPNAAHEQDDPSEAVDSELLQRPRRR